MNNTPIDIPAPLMDLKNKFTEHGYELWFVGGAVRDRLMGLSPKDVDLTTSATPEEAIALYKRYGYSYHETGMSHGTVTVVLDYIPYEITTYRIDRDTDGRHATVEYTRDLRADLGRRDLTINSIAMSFDGEIFDPFGGVADIENNRVRFVGVAEDRLKEDYLRILRWLRFYGRFGAQKGVPDQEACDAITNTAHGLDNISVERIWSEVSKIIAGPNAMGVLDLMRDLGVSEVIGLPRGSNMLLNKARSFSRNPAFLMAAFLGKDTLDIAMKWKWSNEERQAARFMVKRDYFTYDLAKAKRDVYEGWSKDLVAAVLRIGDQTAAADIIDTWTPPVFPVSGSDLIDFGITPGPAMGVTIKLMKERWIASDYALSKTDILNA